MTSVFFFATRKQKKSLVYVHVIRLRRAFIAHAIFIRRASAERSNTPRLSTVTVVQTRAFDATNTENDSLLSRPPVNDRYTIQSPQNFFLYVPSTSMIISIRFFFSKQLTKYIKTYTYSEWRRVIINLLEKNFSDLKKCTKTPDITDVLEGTFIQERFWPFFTFPYHPT